MLHVARVMHTVKHQFIKPYNKWMKKTKLIELMQYLYARFSQIFSHNAHHLTHGDVARTGAEFYPIVVKWFLPFLTSYNGA